MSPTGSILQLNGLPYDTGVNWYQLSISNGTASRTYNMYMKGDAQHGIYNPLFPGTPYPGAIALDNLASLPAALPLTEYLTSINVLPFNGGNLSMDPSASRGGHRQFGSTLPFRRYGRRRRRRSSARSMARPSSIGADRRATPRSTRLR